MNTRTVFLSGGKFDGAKTIASHDTAWHGGELYVWNGGEDKDTFIHAVSYLSGFPVEQQQEERARVVEWMNRPRGTQIIEGVEFPGFPPPLSDLIPIPVHRINAWIQVEKAGLEWERNT